MIVLLIIIIIKHKENSCQKIIRELLSDLLRRVMCDVIEKRRLELGE